MTWFCGCTDKLGCVARVAEVIRYDPTKAVDHALANLSLLR